MDVAAARTAAPQNSPHGSGQSGKHAMWIAGRVQVLLSHYFQPDQPQEVTETAVRDWVSALIEFDQAIIEQACQRYINNQPRRRPTPADIRTICADKAQRANGGKTGRGNKAALSRNELEILEMQAIPTARRWLGIPNLKDHGRQFLDYWGET